MVEKITKYDDIIDSRDVIARIDELFENAPLNEDDAEELKALRTLAEKAEGYASNWQSGEALIRDSYFKEYAMDLAEDIGAVDSDHSWPNYCIDWDQAARDLQMNYTAVDFNGVTYWIR